MASDKVARRRRYGEEFKAQVLAECDAPGRVGGQGGDGARHQRQRRAPLAASWLAKARRRLPPSHGEFVAGGRCAGCSRAASGRRDIEVELRRGAVTMKITWPSSAAADFGRLDARAAAVIRVDCGVAGRRATGHARRHRTALARVVNVFGAARPHHAYLFANRRANRMKVLVHDGIGVWLAARRLNSGKFVWPKDARHDTDPDAARSSMPWCSACRGSASARPASSPCCRRDAVAQLLQCADARVRSARHDHVP